MLRVADYQNHIQPPEHSPWHIVTGSLVLTLSGTFALLLAQWVVL